MSYIDESLAPNEGLIYRANFHWLQKAGAYFTLALFVVMAVASLLIVQSSSALIGALVLTVAGVVMFVALMMADVDHRDRCHQPALHLQAGLVAAQDRRAAIDCHRGGQLGAGRPWPAFRLWTPGAARHRR